MPVQKVDIAALRKRYEHLIQNIAGEEYVRLSDVDILIQGMLDGKGKKAEHWAALCKAYSDWYKEQFGFTPDFRGAESTSMKQVVSKLKAIAEENKYIWTEEIAVMYLLKFLKLAYEDKWLKENFLMKNINQQFSKIRASGRAKKEGGDNKIGRISTKDINKFLAD